MTETHTYHGIYGDFEYQLNKSTRKSIGIRIVGRTVIVSAPNGCPQSTIAKVLKSKEEWIFKCLFAAAEAERKAKSNISDEDWPKVEKKYRMLCKKVVKERCDFFAEKMSVSYNRISIKEMKSRWGSCSSDGNLSFQWRLILAPKTVLDYVVVHELAHRKHMDHSPAFWHEVEKVLPDYKVRRKWLKDHEKVLSLCRDTEVFKGECKDDFYL